MIQLGVLSRSIKYRGADSRHWYDIDQETLVNEEYLDDYLDNCNEAARTCYGLHDACKPTAFAEALERIEDEIPDGSEIRIGRKRRLHTKDALQEEDDDDFSN